jgi:hypothetical protein
MLMKSFKRLVTALILITASAFGHAAAEVEGFLVEDAIVEDGARLVLNGIAVHKRGYFKTELAALYLPERTQSPEVVYRTNGVRVLRRTILRDVPMSTASRYFVNDFKVVATEAEFKQLIGEIGALGSIYGSIPKVSRGDVIDTIWLPNKGMYGRFNGKRLSDQYTKNDLFWQVYMRMYVGAAAQESFRNGLLGINKD